MKRKGDWFLPGMALATILAWLIPAPGARGGILHPELLTKAGVALIFFLHGLALSFGALKAGTLRWRLHAVVQAGTYLLFPLLGLALLRLAGNWLSEDLQLGFFYLCVLPSTVSSSVALTAAARGNVAAAVFNASLSSLLGIFLTPLWVGWMLHKAGNPMPLGKVILDLVIWLLLPLAVGQLCRPWLSAWAARHKPLIRIVDRLTILLLVYTSFCDSFQSGVWSRQGPAAVGLTFMGAALLFTLVMAIMGRACDVLHFSPPDRIAAVFCGSKKTLASGVPMAQLIFATHPGISLILLPIMIYHPMQLIICGVLAERWAERSGP
jgi:solute carrier family 10 (sodium/bile acid cotransporter), member 7